LRTRFGPGLKACKPRVDRHLMARTCGSLCYKAGLAGEATLARVDMLTLYLYFDGATRERKGGRLRPIVIKALSGGLLALPRGGWVCPSHMSYVSAIRRSPAHCRHNGVHQLFLLGERLPSSPGEVCIEGANWTSGLSRRVRYYGCGGKGLNTVR
jgi:hypothetical protein